MSKVSIIVPVYNAQNSIRRCIESILNQDYKDIELIVVDDGSKDDSAKILDEFAIKDNRMIVIHKPNSGVSDTRNLAISKVTGEYIQFLDADDYIPLDSTKSMVRAIEDNDVDLVVSDFYRVVGDKLSKKGSISNDGVLSRNEYAELMALSPADFYYGVLWNKLYKTEIIKEHNIQMDKELSFCEDSIFNLEYLLHCKNIYTLQVPVYYYIKTEGSLVSQNLNVSKIYNAKTSVFKYYDSFFKEILSEKEYAKDRLLISRYLIAVAQDAIVNPLSLNTHKVGEESVTLYKQEVASLEPSSYAYYFNTIYERYLNTLALKYNLNLVDVKLLDIILKNHDLSIDKDVSKYIGSSIPQILISLEKLSSKKMINLKMNNFDIHVSINEDSKEVIKDLNNVTNDIYEICFKGMSDSDKDLALSLIDNMISNIKNFLK